MDVIAFCCNISESRGKHIYFEPEGFRVLYHVFLINTFIFSSVQSALFNVLFFFFLLAGIFKLYTLPDLFFFKKGNIGENITFMECLQHAVRSFVLGT